MKKKEIVVGKSIDKFFEDVEDAVKTGKGGNRIYVPTKEDAKKIRKVKKMKPKFQNVMGSSDEVKVLEFFLENKGLDFACDVIWEETDVLECSHVVRKLVKIKVLKKTRKIGRLQAYKIDMRSKIAKSLDNLFLNILKKD